MALRIRDLGVNLKEKDALYTPAEQKHRMFIFAQDNTIIDKALISQEFAVSSLAELTEQLASGYNNMTISINDDIVTTEMLTIPEGKKIVLDLTDHNISCSTTVFTVNGELVLNGGSISGSDKSIKVANGGKLIINNTDVTCNNNDAIRVTNPGSYVEINGGNITAQEFGIFIIDGATVVVNDGYLKGLDNFGLGGNGHKYINTLNQLTSTWIEGETRKVEPTNVTINGGIIEGNIVSNGYIATAIHWPNSGTLTINGGRIYGDCGICQRGGIININSGVSISADGESGIKGKAGDSRVVVGPYAIVYDQQSNYPDAENMQLNIAEGVQLVGTDGDINIMVGAGFTPNINDNREIIEIPFTNYNNYVDLSNMRTTSAQIIKGSYSLAGLGDEKIWSNEHIQIMPTTGELIFTFKNSPITITLNCETGHYTIEEE